MSQTPQHQADHRHIDPGLARLGQAFIVLAQATRAVESGQGTLDGPALGQDVKAHLTGQLVNDLQLAGQRVVLRKGVIGQVRVVYFLSSDHLGSVTETTNEGVATLYQRERYRPYGQVRYGGAPTTYNFTGQRLDYYINLLEMGARWYDPALGRFISPDPIVPQPNNPQSLNRYTYTLNNPVKYVDPTGYVVEPTGGLGGTCVGVQCLGPDWQSHWAGLYWWQLPSYVQTVASLGPEGVALDAHSWDVEWGPAPGNTTDVAGTLADPAVYASAAAGGGISGLWGSAARGIGGAFNSAFASLSGWCVSNPICSGIVFGTTADRLAHVPASDIRFTQDSISWATSNGVPLDVLTQEIDNGFFQGTIDVVDIGGQLYSLDNRRLAAFKLLDHQNVPINMLDLNDPLTVAELNRKFTTTNDGMSIVVRGTEIIINWRGEVITR